MAARRDTAARRYAEAASEIAMRDGTVEVWRSELDMAGAVVEDPAVARHAGFEPTATVEEAVERARTLHGGDASVALVRYPPAFNRR